MNNYTSSGIGNVRYENAGHVQNNVTTAEFASNLSANICLLLAMQTLSDLISKHRSIFLVDLKKFFMKSFQVENLCFTFLKKRFVKLFYKSNFMAM